MSNRVMIPETEYQERIKKAAALVQERGFDVLVVNSNEADYANVRYFSNFWPLFETAGVAISPTGESALMVGPESEEYSADRSEIVRADDIMVALRGVKSENEIACIREGLRITEIASVAAKGMLAGSLALCQFDSEPDCKVFFPCEKKRAVWDLCEPSTTQRF